VLLCRKFTSFDGAGVCSSCVVVTVECSVVYLQVFDGLPRDEDAQGSLQDDGQGLPSHDPAFFHPGKLPPSSVRFNAQRLILIAWM